MGGSGEERLKSYLLPLREYHPSQTHLAASVLAGHVGSVVP